MNFTLVSLFFANLSAMQTVKNQLEKNSIEKILKKNSIKTIDATKYSIKNQDLSFLQIEAWNIIDVKYKGKHKLYPIEICFKPNHADKKHPDYSIKADMDEKSITDILEKVYSANVECKKCPIYFYYPEKRNPEQVQSDSRSRKIQTKETSRIHKL